MQQSEAFDLMKMGNNIFLTGAPGSGKTHLLNKYIRYLKEHDVRVAVTASTGIAATHLQGVTIHSWSGIGVRDSLTSEDLEKILTKKLIKQNYKKTKTLIIDEISMLHKHQLDMIDTVARHILGTEKPFGGMQVILCGDFFQLPPVSSASALLGNKIEFAFEAEVWRKGNFHFCYLEEQHRQVNDPLFAILQDMRSGTTGEHTKVPLRTRYKKEPIGNIKATKLYSRNINVDAINEAELKSLSVEEKIFSMSSCGYSALVDSLKRNCLAQEQLKLKVGAAVMFIKNEATGKYVNGTRGVVVGFDQEEGWPVVRMHDSRTIIVYPEEWKYEEHDIVRATISQVPLRLAWAITIHKSQGMTLDAAEIDLGDVFELGMGYVALSRLRTLNGLKLVGFNELALKVHPKIMEYDKIFKANSQVSKEQLSDLSEKEKERIQKKTLTGRFGGRIPVEGETDVRPKAKARIWTGESSKKKNSKPTHMLTWELVKQKLSLEAIAKQRELAVSTVLSHLEKLKGLKVLNNEADILHFRNNMSNSDFNNIFDALLASEDGKLTTIFEKFSGKFSFEDIKYVRLFVHL